MTGLRKAAAVSLNISMDSFSRASKTEGDEITISIVVCGVLRSELVEVKCSRCLKIQVSQRL
jgi:hypothetical protein